MPITGIYQIRNTHTGDCYIRPVALLQDGLGRVIPQSVYSGSKRGYHYSVRGVAQSG
jgi:hypothetical protein